MNKKETLALLIDGHSLVYRAFYALPSFKNSQGEGTSAIYGFLNMLLKLLKENEPSYVVVSFDLPTPTYRHKLFKGYKATRQKMPETLTPQIKRLKEILPLFGITPVEKEGLEGDDIIGTLSAKYSKNGIKSLIVTGDKDLLQLVTDDIYVMKSTKGVSSFRLYTPESVEKEFGIPAERIADLKSIIGDKSDNIAGIPGIGIKTATKLLQQFKSIEGLYKNIDKVENDKTREKLIENKELALKNKQLIKIECNADIEINLEDTRKKEIDYLKLQKILEELELFNLMKRLGISKSAVKREEETEISDIKELIKYAKTTKTLTIKILKNKKEVHLTSKDINCVIDESELDKIREILEDPNIKKYGNDIKEDYIYMSKIGIELKGISFDTAVASYLLEPSKRHHSVKNINLFLFKKEALSRVVTEDIEKSVPLLERLLEENGLILLFKEIEIPLIEILAEMQLTGIKVDKKILSELGRELTNRIIEIQKHIIETVNMDINLNSPKQLSNLLFGILHLPPIKKTKSGFSTDFETLNDLFKITGSPLLKELIEYRQLTKVLNSYITPLLELIDKKTGKIHASFNQMATSTGRLSSSNPNLQNIPIYSDIGKKLRKAFVVSSEDNIFLSADYSQIELRLLAHFSKDQTLIKAFKEDIDIHRLTAHQIFGVRMEDVDSEMRRQAKAINFGIIYGMSDYGLARSVDISRKEAKRYIENYFKRYPGVKAFIEETITKARETGITTTIAGRIRKITEINSRNKTIQKEGERLAINTPIQGSAADLIKIAMINSVRKIKENGLKAKLILQIHDELIFELPERELDIFKPMIKEEMESAMQLDVPLKVNISTGKSWGKLDK